MESESDKCVSLRVLYCRQRLSITLRVLIGLELDQAKGRFVPPPAVGIRMMAVLICILNENRRIRVEVRKRPIDAKSCERTVGYRRRLCVPYSNVAWYPSIVTRHVPLSSNVGASSSLRACDETESLSYWTY